MRRVVVLAAASGVAVLIVRRLRVAAGMRRKDAQVIDQKRARNKRFANKIVNRLGRAGRARSIFAVISYTGRRTGRRYAVPVRLLERRDGFIIPLTYGPRTGWYVHLRTQSAQLQWQGRTYVVGDPSLVPAHTVIPELPLVSRLLIRLDGVDEFIHLRILTAATIPADGRGRTTAPCGPSVPVSPSDRA